MPHWSTTKLTTFTRKYGAKFPMSQYPTWDYVPPFCIAQWLPYSVRMTVPSTKSTYSYACVHTYYGLTVFLQSPCSKNSVRSQCRMPTATLCHSPPEYVYVAISHSTLTTARRGHFSLEKKHAIITTCGHKGSGWLGQFSLQHGLKKNSVTA
jgi:hypothetical protein